MAASRSSSPRLIAGVLGAVLLACYLLVAQSEDIRLQIMADRAGNREAVGIQFAQRAEDRAIWMFDRLFVRTGLVRGSYAAFDRDTPAQIGGREIGATASKASEWMAERIDVFCLIALMGMIRIAMAALWLPFCLLLLLAFVVDAFVTRKIKAISFGTPSPHAFRIARSVVWTCPLLGFALVVAPIHIPAELAPVVALLFAASLWAAIGQFAKRA